MTLFEAFLHAPFALIPIGVGLLLYVLSGREGSLRTLGEFLIIVGIVWGVLVGFVIPYVPFAVQLRLP